MAVRGSNTNFWMYDESAYAGAFVPSSSRKLHLLSCGLSATQAKDVDETLSSDRTQKAPMPGNIDAGGSLGMNMNAESMAFLFKHAFGTVDTVGAAAPYTHTYTIGALPAGFVIEKDLQDISQFERFVGCRVSQMSVEVASSGPVKVNFDIKAAKSDWFGSALETGTDYGHQAFSGFQISEILEGGSPIATVKSAQFTLSNSLDEDGYVINTAAQGVRGSLSEGMAVVTGQVVAKFEDMSLLQKAIDNNQTSLKVAWSRGNGTGTAGNEYVELESGALVYDLATPPVEGPGAVLATLAFKAYGTDALKAVIKNPIVGTAI